MTAAAALRAADYPPRHLRDAVRALIRRGFRVVPVPFGEKGPTLTGWPQLQITEAQVDRYFSEDDNVGLLLGDQPTGKALCDTDLDIVEAIRAARRRLPNTEMRHGRASKPDSHAWFYTDLGCPTRKYVDPVDKATILERRCNAAKEDGGLQTCAPPSINPSGELQQYTAGGEPAFVTQAELIAAHDDIAAISLLARYLADGRHEGALHFAGFLLRRGLPLERVELLMVMLADALDLPARVDEFLRLTRDTAKAIAAGRPATGGGKLIEHLGPNGKTIVSKVSEWLGLHSDAADEAPPLDLWGSHLAGRPHLDLETLPPVLADLAADVSARVGCDPALVGITALGVCAAAIDDRHQIQPRQYDTQWRTSPRAWVVCAEDVAGGKSPALAAVLAPLKALDALWVAEDAPAQRRYQLSLRVYNRDLEKWVKAGGVGDLPAEPPRPPARRRLCEDITTEALSDILVDNEGGVLLFADELTALIGGMDAYRPSGVVKDQPLYLQLKEGGRRVIERVKRGKIVVPNWAASILGGIQPERLRQLAVKMIDDGMLARCLVFFGVARAVGIDRPADHRALDRYERTIKALAAYAPPKSPYTLSAEAHRRREYVVQIARAVAVLPTTAPGLAAHLGKWEGEFARLVLTAHLVEAAADGAVPELVIEAETADRVARLMVGYLLPHAAYLYGELLGQDHLTHARWIAGHILAHKSEKISARDICRAYHSLRDDSRGLEQAMLTLTVAGWVTPIDPQPGRAATRWRVNPAVHRLFGARAEAEKQHRDTVRERIRLAQQFLGLDEGTDE